MSTTSYYIPHTMTVAEYARFERISEEQVRRALRDGRIIGERPTGAPRGAWRIPWTEVQRLRTETRAAGHRDRRDRKAHA